MPQFQTTPEAYKLIHLGSLALARIEHRGVRVDMGYLTNALDNIGKLIKDQELALKSGKTYNEWKRAYGDKINFGSGDQLADVLFNRMGLKASGATATGRVKTDKRALEQLDHPFVKRYIRLKELKNARSTFLTGILRAAVETPLGWFIHPSYKLNCVTFRSSCEDPNFQNQPARNPEIAEIVRRCYIPRFDYFTEIDYGQIEVRVPASLTQDPNLRKYIFDPNTDMHKDSACEVWLLKRDQVSKPIRQSTKSRFVFASFFGSTYFQTAKGLWDDIEIYKLKLADGTPLKQHLASRGITSLGEFDPQLIKAAGGTVPGTFVHHMKSVEQKLWKRFDGYAKWKERIYEKYQKNKGMVMVTGFAVTGLHSKNEITNYPIQGPAFHCTLNSIIEIERRLLKYKMKSINIGEIHDSIQGDCPRSELSAYADICYDVMTQYIPSIYKWIDVPLEVEIEVSPLGKPWFEKQVWVQDTESLWWPPPTKE